VEVPAAGRLSTPALYTGPAPASCKCPSSEPLARLRTLLRVAAASVLIDVVVPPRLPLLTTVPTLAATTRPMPAGSVPDRLPLLLRSTVPLTAFTQAPCRPWAVPWLIRVMLPSGVAMYSA
jgi:hypothetical protein